MNIANILTLHCHILNFYNVAVSPYDAEDAKGLPLLVHDQGFSINTKISAALIRHKNSPTTNAIIDQHRSLPGWFDDSILLLISDDIPNIHFFKFLWHKRLFYVILITTDGKLYSYNPFKSELQSNCNLENIWKDLNGWTMKMSAYYDPVGYSGLGVGSGVDGSSMYELSKYLNFTIFVIKTKDLDSAVDHLIMGISEIIANAYFTCFFDKDIHTITHALYSDQECVAMKEGKILRGWHVFLLTFNWEVWALIITIALLTNGAVAWLSKNRTWHASMPLTLRAMFMIPLRRPPKNTVERLILGGCLIFGVVVVTTYQASLYHFIKIRVKYKIPETLDEIKQPVIDYESLSDSVTDEFFNKHAISIRRKLFDLMVYNGKFGNLQLLPECQCTGSLGYALKQGSALLVPINRFVLRIGEAGLAEAWYKQTIYKKEKKTFQEIEEEEVRVLNLQDVEVAFVELIAGLIISALVFLLEILSSLASHHWFYRWQLTTHQIYIN
ncbi:hypothetical protein O3M35_009237 [Rhynocoris fuscipes]|uniref:Ionotropic receptor n=1 Tax=Rhynocoris fuscipes TaxID=488301 RepID=A0AAW1D301_9HEMI